MRVPLFFVILLFFGNCAIGLGQKSGDELSKKDKKRFERSLVDMNAGYYDKAIGQLKNLQDKYPRNATITLYLGSAAFQNRDYSAAMGYYERTLDIDPNFNNKLYYSIGLCAYREEDYQKAKKFVQLYLKKENKNKDVERKAKKLIQNIESAILLTAEPYPFSPVRLNFKNTPRVSEYMPSLTGDGKIMTFTLRVLGQEDIYISNDVNGQWDSPTPISDINTPGNEGAAAISPDGQYIVFTKCNRISTFGSCDLFISYKTEKGWTSGANMGRKINSKAWESQPCISQNGQALYFSSNRPGGYGGKDIWVSYLNRNGEWSRAKNLGPSINTTFSDETPFLHPDNTSLYFTSDRHTSIGDNDIYMARKRDNHFENIKNLGYPINTQYHEGSFTTDMNRSTGYFASDRFYFKENNKNNNLDIYAIKLNDSIAPLPVQKLSLSVFDDNETNIPVKITIIDTSYNNLAYYHGGVSCRRKQFYLASENTFQILIEHPSYLPVIKYIRLVDSSPSGYDYLLDVRLQKPKGIKEETFVLNNILFDYDSHTLQKAEQFELNVILQLLKSQKDLKAEINGYTDDVGTEDYNLELSKKRSMAVRNYLIDNGVMASRLLAIGKGECCPIATNKTEIGRRQNRRTEIRISY